MSFCCMFGCRIRVAKRILTLVNECMHILPNAVHNTEISESNFTAQVPATAFLAVVVDLHLVEQVDFQ